MGGPVLLGRGYHLVHLPEPEQESDHQEENTAEQWGIHRIPDS